MIELRWLKREIKRDPKISHYHGPDEETVLQFRTWTDTTARTPWRDVPCVDESTARLLEVFPPKSERKR